MEVIKTTGVPIFNWAYNPDQGAIIQAMNLAELSMVLERVAMMADAHQGYGVPIGTVFVAQDAVIPNAVGLDIGCSVTAIQFNLKAKDVQPKLQRILAQVQEVVPSGFNWHEKPQDHEIFNSVPDIYIVKRELNRARRQLGTLGGGNHFLEFSVDEDENLWLMIHTGSRNIGKLVAEEFNAMAEELNQFGIPKEHELCALSTHTRFGQNYLEAMNFCLRFAEASHQLICARVIEAMRPIIGRTPVPKLWVYTRHNYAELLDGGRVIHRKGAVHAHGLVAIPGSMGTRSYIGRGLAEKLSFESCSHGAGRALSRKKAKKTWTSDQIFQEMQDKGIQFVKTGKKQHAAEEASGAYKDIDQVMVHQVDLVEPAYILTPIAVLKG